MKTSTTSLKSNLFFLALALTLPLSAQAALVGKVHELKGEAFLLTNGKTKSITKDMDIESGAQIMVTDEAQLTIGDFYDRRIHLKSGSHLVMNAAGAILHKGSAWVQSYGSKGKWTLATANLQLSALKSEFLVSYHPADKLSQLTVIAGEVNAANPAEPTLQYLIVAGQMTQSHPDVDNGYPRSPVAVGQESLMAAVKQFSGIKSMDAGVAHAQSQAARSIASVEKKAGDIIFMKTVLETERKPASVGDEAQKYYLKKTVKKAKKLGVAKVRIIGYQAVKAPTIRKPASSRPAQSQEPVERVNDMDFLKSYEQLKRTQPIHSKEVQRLIDDLKSY